MIDFPKCVLECFGFLVRDYNFRCAISCSETVRFESDVVFVVVYFNSQGNFEVGVNFGEVDKPTIAYGLGEVLKSNEVEDADYVSQLQVSNEDVVRRVVDKLAVLTREYGERFIKGDKLAFALLKKHRQDDIYDYDLARRLRGAREDALNAWNRKDYASTVRSYEFIDTHLSSSEKKRLDMARRMLKQN